MRKIEIENCHALSKRFSSRFVFILLQDGNFCMQSLIQRPKGLHSLAFIKLRCELGHMAQKQNRGIVKGFLQGSNSLPVTTVELLPLYGMDMRRCCTEKCSIVI